MDIEDEMADNTDIVKEQESEITTPVINQEVDQTKAFAKRLKESTEKARIEERENIAKSFGYESWSEYLDAQTNNKILDKGLDPEAIKPMIKELIQNDPDYLDAMAIKKEKENLEKEFFAQTAIKDLNEKFGTKYASVNDLDEETITMWNKGISLEKAYAANNWNKIKDLATQNANITKMSKDHLKDVEGGSTKTTTRQPTNDEKALFRKLNPGITDEQILAFLNKK